MKRAEEECLFIVQGYGNEDILEGLGIETDLQEWYFDKYI